MNNEIMTLWGFWISIAGTLFGFISLLIGIYISNNTIKIRKNFTKNHLRIRYKKTKGSILLQINTSYGLLKEFNRLDVQNIKEGIISLSLYDDILTMTTKRKLKKLRKKINNPNSVTKQNRDHISELLFEIIVRLENELDEYNDHIKETTK
ncbi:hypothetical protein [Sporosarcina aquimarina]|uniref:DUF304 domain-containing protein n=1 Tax=Sporosarcina aquimarina TaxID=114975 RepID=A0ABU4G3I1_9BACL|nr:hypothetical protein [Sporosarcina aquimarina]MDW0111523.1 hypothetical protein [Sporosarcina aquimarina]